MITPESSDPRAVLAVLEQRARRRFGQHFLKGTEVVDRIVRLARVKPGELVVEIGPGLGVLTDALHRAGAEVLAVELDRDLAAWLRESRPWLTVVEADAMKVDWDALLGEKRVRVVANLPYNIGTHVVMQLVRRPERFLSLTVMLQKEVVQRLCAEAGNKAYGALSLELQLRATPVFGFLVPPGAFHPPPKVESALVRLEIKEADQIPAGRAFDQVVRAAFAQRRKTILNSLSSRLPRNLVAEALAEVQLSPEIRAEQVDQATFVRLSEAIARRAPSLSQAGPSTSAD